MRTKARACASIPIEQFLAGELTGNELDGFELHLENCDKCRLYLEQSVAAEHVWESVRESLGAKNELITRASIKRDSQSASETDLNYYRSFLGPSDDPHMMGKIGNYEIVGLLGHGGMGIVFKAHDRPLNRFVAIKILAPQFASSAIARQRFLREAQAAAAVVHEHVIAIHGVAAWQNTPYLVMSYIGGQSLVQRLVESGALGLREVLRIGIQVAAGLAAAHEQGLIHRDVKPANILMESGIDRVVLTDFGLARAVDDIRLTQSDALLGTPQYMSPEQAADQPIDYRSDLFSLGCVLYEAISGRAAFNAATTYGVLRKICECEPIPLRQLNPDVPRWFERFIELLIAKEASQRIASAAEVEKLLKQCLAHVQQPTTVDLPHQLVETEPSFLQPCRSLLMSATVVSMVAFITYLLVAPQDTTRNDPNKAASQNQSENAPKLVTTPDPQAADKIEYKDAEEAYRVGAAFYNSRSYKNSRAPFEAAIRLAKDNEMKLKAYQALLPAYREIPEFEPFQTAAEFVITNSPQNADRSLTRRSFLSFANNRGQTDNLIQRYEAMLAKDKNNYLGVYLLSEIYSTNNKNPKRAVELLKQLEKLEAKKDPGTNKPETDADKIKVAREKAKLAQQYANSKDYKRAAKLYEEIAPLDPSTHAWNLKEAASAWLKDKNKKEALRVAEEAEKAEAEKRNDQLAHFFHRNMGDIFMQLNQPQKAIPHFEIAIEKTNIEGYVKDTKSSLAEAIEKSKK